MQSSTIDFLRFPLTVMVVFIHSIGTPELVLPDYANFGTMDAFNVLRIFLSHGISQVAVPAFFLISGYLYFYQSEHWGWTLYKRKTMKRVYTLIIPYVLWNVISLVVRVGGCVAGQWLPGVGDETFWQECTPTNWLWDITTWGHDRENWLGQTIIQTGPLNAPLWFLRDLICVSLLTPAIHLYVKYLRQWGLLLLALCYVSQIFPAIPGLRITALLYFTLGSYLSIYKYDLVEWMSKPGIPLSGLAVVLLPLVIYFDGVYTDIGFYITPFFVLAALPMVFASAAWMIRKGAKLPQFLSKSSFFIYALHSVLVLRFCSKLSAELIPWQSPLAYSVRYLLQAGLIILICLAIYYILQRFAPRILHLLTGK